MLFIQTFPDEFLKTIKIFFFHSKLIFNNDTL